MRRLTMKNILRPAVRSPNGRLACTARAKTAASKQAVFPLPVGAATYFGQSPAQSRRANSFCQGNGFRSSQICRKKAENWSAARGGWLMYERNQMACRLHNRENDQHLKGPAPPRRREIGSAHVPAGGLRCLLFRVAMAFHSDLVENVARHGAMTSCRRRSARAEAILVAGSFAQYWRPLLPAISRAQSVGRASDGDQELPA